MDGNLSGGNLVSGPYGVLDLHGPLHSHQHQTHQQNHPHSLQQQHLQHEFPLSSRSHMPHESNHGLGMFRTSKNSTSDDDEPSFNEEDTSKGKKNSPWQRMKWTDDMVRLLITIVSYVGEDTNSPDSGRRKIVLLQKKGKWKSVSRVMAARGYFVSPQQCEDKFNDLNKRYKRLTDLLGRGTSCKVVENPALLDSMTHLSEKAKEDVRKSLSSKHLYYEEMCSYHNGNRINLLDDPSLQQCLQSVLKGNSEPDHCRNGGEDQDEEDMDDGDECGDENVNLQSGSCAKRMMLHHNLEEENLWVPGNSNFHEGAKRVCSESPAAGMNETMQRQWIRQQLLHLEEQKLNIQIQTFELESQRFKWQKFSRKKERELDKLRLENEKMKLENERMLLELRKKELEIEYKISEASTGSGSMGIDRLREQTEIDRGECIR
ncbi:stress response protein nst1-like [Aristolochia californica]|uniref:stress response protein nst1-like n=1 Tax=Aristolochia californica TaxID=171875 RepID=UPI0035DA10E2